MPQPLILRANRNATGPLSVKTLLSMALLIVLALTVTFGWRWYGYVSNTDKPL